MDQQMETKIREILTESQYKRYQEIGLQQQGAVALMRPEIGQKVNLSQDQREQIREIMENHRGAMRPPQGGGERPDRQQMQAQMEKNREALNAKIVAVLTGEQKSIWQSMLGRPFKIEHPQGGPGGPGGPGRGPGGGGGQRGGGGGF